MNPVVFSNGYEKEENNAQNSSGENIFIKYNTFKTATMRCGARWIPIRTKVVETFKMAINMSPSTNRVDGNRSFQYINGAV